MRAAFVALVAFAAFVAPAFASRGGPVAVELRQKDRVEGRGPTLLFSDVADLSSEDPAFAQMLARAEIVSLVRVAGDLTVTRAQLSEAARRAGADLALARWRGPEVTFVAVGTLRLGSDDAAALARRKLESALGAAAETAAIRFLRVEGEIAACPGRRKSGFTAAVRGTRLAGEVGVEVAAMSDDTAVGSAFVYFEVRRRGPVLIARREIAAGVVVREQDLAVEERELANVPDGSFDRLDLAAGLVAARRVPIGTPVGAFDVRPRPVVLRGQDVLLRFAEGPLLVTARARALQDGAPGERIEVLHGAARKAVLARVVDTGVVEVSSRNPESPR
jgi:flagella basal body P-ring formation protein FlgA